MKNYKELNKQMLECLFPENEKQGFIDLDLIDDIVQFRADLKSEGYETYIENDKLIVLNKEV